MWMSFGGLIMCTLLVLLHLSHFTEVEVPSENICASVATISTIVMRAICDAYRLKVRSQLCSKNVLRKMSSFAPIS